MNPSKSSLDRLPKQLSSRWEDQREAFEEALRAQHSVPAEATTLAVSLDGADAGRGAASQTRQGAGCKAARPRDRPVIGRWDAARCHSTTAQGSG